MRQALFLASIRRPEGQELTFIGFIFLLTKNFCSFQQPKSSTAASSVALINPGLSRPEVITVTIVLGASLRFWRDYYNARDTFSASEPLREVSGQAARENTSGFQFDLFPTFSEEKALGFSIKLDPDLLRGKIHQYFSLTCSHLLAAPSPKKYNTCLILYSARSLIPSAVQANRVPDKQKAKEAFFSLKIRRAIFYLVKSILLHTFQMFMWIRINTKVIY